MYGQCISLAWGQEWAVRSTRLHDLIPICQQHRNLLKSAITTQRKRPNVWVDSGLCAAQQIWASGRETLSRHGMGELRAPWVRTMQPVQLNPQSPLNYAAMLITRECTLKESLHSTQRLSPTLYSLPFAVANTKGWNGIMGIQSGSRETHTVPTNDHGTSPPAMF